MFQQREPTFDPFGEPIDLPGVCTDAKGYGETRCAALVFWGLALMFLAGRVYLSDLATPQTVAANVGMVSVQVAALR